MEQRKALVLALGILTCSSTAAFGGEKVNLELTADFEGKYIWRGQNVNNESVFQPSVSLSKYGFTGSIWSNMDLTNKNDSSGEFTEYDFSLDYSSAMPGIDGLDFLVGAIHYRFPNTAFKPTTEVYGGLSFDLPLTPSIKLYRDVDEIDGLYIQFGIGHIFEKVATFSQDCYCGLQIGASTGWGNSAYNKGYFGIDDSKFNDLTLTAGFPICIRLWTIRPSINYSAMLSDSVRSATVHSDNFWGGISISRSF